MKKVSLILLTIILIFSSCSSIEKNPDTPEEVWGKLVAQEGEYIWGTLTKDQQSLINYPKLNDDEVFWVPNGKSYHSIDWCYTLSNSKNILNSTLDDAISEGKSDPCSKCVGD